MLLPVKYEEGNAGIWGITCEQCPLKVHAEALGTRAPDCASGIATNMQGPMVLKTCKHTTTDSLKNENDSLFIECGYEANP